ncbi:hypothetical protein LDFHOB_10700 [Candidatus Electronema aureum]
MDITTANELLLFFLRGEPDESSPTELAQLSEPDWNAVVQQADRYGVASFLYQRLTAPHHKGHVPAEILQTLRTKHFTSFVRNTRLYHEAGKAFQALRQKGIPVILLKGVYLAEAVYGNIALRPMSDVDILVRKADLLQAEKILLELGYSSARADDIESACAKSQHLAPLTKYGAAAVEIHWTVVHPSCPFAIDIEGLWERARPVVIADVEMLTLSPEDVLLHLCIYTVFHRFYRNITVFSDIRETVRCFQGEIDWEQVRFRSRQWGAGNAVYLTLYLAKTLFGANVPDAVLDMLKPESFTPQLAAEANSLIINGPDENGVMNPYLLKLAGSKSILAVARLFVQRIFLSREELSEKYRIHLKPHQIFLYYFVRLKDLLIRYSRTVLRLSQRDEVATRQIHLIDWLGH